MSVGKPKVNYWQCVFAKQWVEKRKRRHTVAKEFNNMKPSLGLFDSDGNFVHEKWLDFKAEYNVNR